MDAVKPGRLLDFFHHHRGAASLASLIRLNHSDTPRDGAAPRTGESLELSADPRAPGRVLSAEIVQRLDIFREGAAAAQALPGETQDFSPGSVAGRILARVAEALDGLDSDAPRRAGLLEQARDGVARGFEAARAQLAASDTLNDDVQVQLENTYALINQGLERLAEGQSVALAQAPSSPDATGARLAFSGAAFSTRENTSLVIDTLDGDRVTIQIDKRAEASRALSSLEAGGLRSGAGTAALSAGVAFSYRVEGELDEDERAAIDDLLARVDRVSETFFDGNVQAAFNQAAALGIEGGELASFSVQLSQVQRFEAVAAYQGTGAEGQASGAPEAIEGYGRDLRELFEQAPRTPLARPSEAAADLFRHVFNERARSQFGELRDQAFSALDGLVAQLRDEYRAREAQASGDGAEHQAETGRGDDG